MHLVKCKKQTKICFFILLILLSSLISSALATPILPCEISGNVTINNNPAPVGTTVIARIEGIERGQIVVQDKGFFGGDGPFDERLVIEGSEDDLDKEITFSVNNVTADNKAKFEDGKSIQLELNFNVLRGDFNGNGYVDIGDASKVAYMVVKKVPEDLNGDFNTNGFVDIGDASKIAYYIAGKTEFL